MSGIETGDQQKKMKFPKRTRRESLLRLRKLWNCIVDEGFEHKVLAYGFLGWKGDSDSNFCPACTFNMMHRGNYCGHSHGGKCIVGWEEGSKKEKGCMSVDSPYDKWTYNFNKQEAAKEILTLVNKSIEKLEKDEIERRRGEEDENNS